MSRWRVKRVFQLIDPSGRVEDTLHDEGRANRNCAALNVGMALPPVAPEINAQTLQAGHIARALAYLRAGDVAKARKELEDARI